MPTVLLIEDDPLVRGLLQDVFSMWGWSVSSAPSGAAARRLVGRPGEGHVRPDLVVIDLALPDIAGDDLLVELRAGSPWGLRAVVISGEPDAASRAARLGVPCLSKPFNLRSLAGIVDSLAPAAPIPL
jgi:DNA-binding response OmpR family regulator